MKKIEMITVLGFIVLRLSLIVGAILAVYDGNWMSLGLTIFILAVTFLPGVLKRMFHIPIPGGFSLIVILFIYGGTFMGDTLQFYNRFWWWDIMLHSISGPILGNMGFLIINNLVWCKGIGFQGLKNRGIQDIISPAFRALFAVCFAVALGAAWEIFEFSMDKLLHFSMQEASLDDTMWDIILNALGAVMFAGWNLRRKRSWPRMM